MPPNSGYIQMNYGWVANFTDAYNTSDPLWPVCVAGISQSCCTSAGQYPECCQQVYYVTVDVMYQGVSTTSPRVYKQITYDNCQNKVVSVFTFPLLTVIVNLVQGVPSVISWDDGCYFCASNGANCQPYALLTSTWTLASASTGVVSCSTDTADCYVSASPTPAPSPNATSTLASSPCDLQLYVSWSGTDNAGNYLTSQNKRFSRFRQFGTAALQQSAVNIGTAGLNAITGAVNADSIFPGSRRRRLAAAEQAGAPEQPAAEAGAGEAAEAAAAADAAAASHTRVA